MTRFRYVMVTAAATLGIAIAGFVPTAPRLLWNASASVPIGFYTVAPADRIEMPDLVAVMPPEPFASYMVDRGYVARDVAAVHHVGRERLRWHDGDQIGHLDPISGRDGVEPDRHAGRCVPEQPWRGRNESGDGDPQRGRRRHHDIAKARHGAISRRRSHA